MGNSTLFTLPGPWRIPIQFDVSLIILAVFFGFLYMDRGIGVAAIAMAMLVLAILLHELGHAAACVVQGVPVSRVVLFGGGGFCEFSGSVSPRQREFIAVAGPLVNLTLWAFATLALPFTQTPIIPETIVNGYPITPFSSPDPLYTAVYTFSQLNLFLALFNLLPVLPLDGGQLLNSWLHRFVRGHTANRISGAVGVGMAVLWIPLMFAAFFTFGFVLIFLPQLRYHWRLMRHGMA